MATEPVTFTSGDAELRGELRLPAEPAGALPALVVGGSWTTVRGQMADRYAEAMAERGYAALSFDFTGYGDSGGEPRDVEHPQLKARDFTAAVNFLTGRPDIDDTRLAVLTVCASAGYAALAATTDHRIRALAMIAPWLHNAELVAQVYGGDDAVAERIAAGHAARDDYDRTGHIEYVPAQSPTDPRAAMPMQADYYENSARGAVPAWPNRFAVMAWPLWLQFDPISLAPQLSTPTLIVHSPDAAIPDGAQQFHDNHGGDISITWLTGEQFDFYDQPDHVSRSADFAANHFTHHLSAGA